MRAYTRRDGAWVPGRSLRGHSGYQCVVLVTCANLEWSSGNTVDFPDKGRQYVCSVRTLVTLQSVASYSYAERRCIRVVWGVESGSVNHVR